MHISSYTSDYLGHCHWLLADFLNKAANSKFLSGTAVTMTVTCRIERVNRGKFRDQFTRIPTEMPLFLVCYCSKYSAHTTGLKHVSDLIAESVDPGWIFFYMIISSPSIFFAHRSGVGGEGGG
jgi:hypothetical protein